MTSPGGPSTSVAELLASVTERAPMSGHDGRSGAVLERGVLDGRPVVVKSVGPGHDLAYVDGGEPTGRERRLWAAGVLDQLPAGVGHPILAAGWEGGRLVTIMRDLGDAMLGWDRTLTRPELDRVLGALRSLHEHFADRPPDGLAELPRRLSQFAPARTIGSHHPLARVVAEGWEHFSAIAPPDIVTTVSAALADPKPLAEILASGPLTLCHGDAWIVNMALCDAEVVLLDWNLATRGPASLDFVELAVGCASHLGVDLESLLALCRDACGSLVDDAVWDASLLWALCELGWNKALDAATHADRRQRARAASELAWWSERAADALGRLGPIRRRAC